MSKTCYLGQKTEECCDERVKQAVRNTIYVFILLIGVGALILSLTIKSAADEVFVDQVSFASTITSIILSVVAIWMSITGERSTNEIKDKVKGSVDELVKNTEQSHQLVNQFREIIKKQEKNNELVFGKIDDMNKNMESVGSSLSDIKSMVSKPKENKLDNLVQPDAYKKEDLLKKLLDTFNDEKAADIFKKSIQIYKDNSENIIPVKIMLEYYTKNNIDVEFGMMCIGFLWVLDCNNAL